MNLVYEGHTVGGFVHFGEHRNTRCKVASSKCAGMCLVLFVMVNPGISDEPFPLCEYHLDRMTHWFVSYTIEPGFYVLWSYYDRMPKGVKKMVQEMVSPEAWEASIEKHRLWKESVSA